MRRFRVIGNNSVASGATMMLAALSVLLLFSGALAAPQKPEKAYRMTVRYFQGKFTLVKSEEINKVLSPILKARRLKDGETPTGFYFEIMDSQGRILTRSAMPDPTTSLMEYPDPDDPTKIRSALVAHDDVTFALLVPATPGGEKVHFLRRRPAQPGVVAVPGPEDLGTFELKVVR
jgi:hypothetical protein